MINRTSTKELSALMKQFPAVVILGARQVGKTTLAKQVAEKLGNKCVYFDLEKQSDRNKLADIESTLMAVTKKCVIVDEAQTMPELYTALRPLIDEYRKPGRYLLLGSIAPHLIEGISETLAGRMAQIEIGTVNILEADKANVSQDTLWHRGGYPEALLLKNDTQWYRWVENYYKNFISRDVNFLMDERLSPSTVAKLWTMLADINGNILNLEMLSRSLGISRPTVSKYLEFMEGAYLVARLQPWFMNVSKRLVKSPKLYFRDTGVFHYLNSISSLNDLQGSVISGASWEGFVVEQIRQLKNMNIKMYYYRTHHGAEADIVLVKGTKPVACIEIKISNTPSLTKGWHEVINDLKTTNNFVITPNSDTYKYNTYTTVCSLKDFVMKYLKKIK
jgi:uncharacterized protein